MKKRCLYCGTIVKCDITVIDKEKGYGVYCDVCSSFIKLTRQIHRTVEYSRKIPYKTKINNQRIMAGMVFMIILLAIPILYIVYIMPDYYVLPEQRTYSIFALYDNKTGIDVSNSVEISILFPKEDSIFKNTDDVNNVSKFEVVLIAKASDIQIDLRNILYIWMQIDPLNKTMYQSKYGLLVGGHNGQFCFYVCIYDIPIVESSFWCVLRKP